MNRLEQLINELCPDGVEFAKVGEICKILKGTRLTKSQLNSSGKYPVVHGGMSPLGYYNECNRKAGTTVVINTGNAGCVYWADKEFWASDACFSLYPEKNLLDRFLYFVMLENESILKSKIRSVGTPFINEEIVSSLKIPVPPLEIQTEIIKILDGFAELSAVLDSELSARRRQFEYYRDSLLDFGDDVERKTLGEIGKISMCRRIRREQTNPESGVPFFKTGTLGGTPDAYISVELFNDYKANYPYPKAGDVLVSTIVTVGKAVVFDGKPAYFRDSGIVWIENDEKLILNRFLYYFYQTKPWKSLKCATVARLCNEDLAKTKIPVPSIEEQRRIIALLDRFDSLCNDSAEGLPAEIAARKKQYEYYRSKLLTFKEVTL